MNRIFVIIMCVFLFVLTGCSTPPEEPVSEPKQVVENIEEEFAEPVDESMDDLDAYNTALSEFYQSISGVYASALDMQNKFAEMIEELDSRGISIGTFLEQQSKEPWDFTELIGLINVEFSTVSNPPSKAQDGYLIAEKVHSSLVSFYTNCMDASKSKDEALNNDFLENAVLFFTAYEESLLELYDYVKTNSDQSLTVSPPSSETVSQANALRKAKDYLRFTAFSYSGLIKQLEYEGFSSSDAKYGADNCGADWNEQAAKKAKQYLDMNAFSRSRLIDQLVFEGFTREQAEFGVNSVGL